jgi:hypothetical protein
MQVGFCIKGVKKRRYSRGREEGFKMTCSKIRAAGAGRRGSGMMRSGSAKVMHITSQVQNYAEKV